MRAHTSSSRGRFDRGQKSQRIPLITCVRETAAPAEGPDSARVSSGCVPRLETARIPRRENVMQVMQVQGVHHITLVGSTRQSAIDFWQGLLGMKFIFEQPNLGRPDESHLYFDPGDGRLITVFTNEQRQDDPSP